MNLTPEDVVAGRRNFLKVLAGTPALAALGTAALVKGPVRGGPVRLGYIGLGGQGRVLLEQTDPAYGEVKALCDVNPTSLGRADEALKKSGRPAAAHYVEWKDMLAKEDIEGVVVAAPLWKHAEIVSGCLDAGKHVLCEKMMAWDVEGAQQMLEAARRNDRVLEIGYQRFYNPIYQAAYQAVVKAGVLGDIYHARLVWHRNGNWRRQGTPPTPEYDPSPWGYPTFEHLINWRLYWRYSKGLLAELASHQVAIADWFFGGLPESVQGSGGVHRFKDGREVHDHVYVTFEYPHGRTAVFSSIESNAFDHYYEMYLGTKGTLILRGETEAFLFEEGSGGGERRPTGLEVAARSAGPVLDASESRSAEAAGGARGAGGLGDKVDRVAAYKAEVSGFCAAVRVGKPLACGPERAVQSTRACVRAHEAIEKKTRVAV